MAESHRWSRCSVCGSTNERLRAAVPMLTRTGSGALVSGGSNVDGPRAALTRLELEFDRLATPQRIEVDRAIEPVAVEEVVLAIFAGDEPKATVGNDLLDRAISHLGSLL